MKLPAFLERARHAVCRDWFGAGRQAHAQPVSLKSRHARANLQDSAPNTACLTRSGKTSISHDVTVVVFVYNHASYLAQCLDSILSQATGYKVQVVCIDDASTDGSVSVLRAYEEHYPGLVKVFANEINLGAARLALFHANPTIDSSYICYLDGDDYWTDDRKLELQIAALEKRKKYVGCCHAYKIAYEAEPQNDKICRLDVKEFDLRDYLGLEKNTYCHTSSWMWRKVFDTPLPPEMAASDVKGDVVLTALYLRRGKALYIDRVMSCYRYTSRGVHSSLDESRQRQQYLQTLETLDRVLKFKYADLITSLKTH